MGNKSEATQSVQLDPQMERYSRRQLWRGENIARDMRSQGLPSTYVGISDPRLAGLEQTQQLAQGGSMVPGAFLPEYQRTMSGQYLDAESNPYLQDIVNRSVSAATSPLLGMDAGRFGGGVYANALADTAASTASRLYGAQYEAERQRMQQMAGLTPMAYGMQYADPMALMDVGRQYEADTAAQKAEEMRQFMFPAITQDWETSQLRMNPLMAATETTTVQPFQWMDIVGGLLNPMQGISSSLPGGGA